MTRKRVVVTGDREDRFRSEDDGSEVDWISLPVLQYESLTVDPALLERAVFEPYEWIIFTSSRGVQFWQDNLKQANVRWPSETQVGCIGFRTAETLEALGYAVDFYPTVPGTEGFVTEFKDMLSHQSDKSLSMLIPMAEKGRTDLKEELSRLGCEVTLVPTYRTTVRSDVVESCSKVNWGETEGIVFTSPSSVDAIRASFQWPQSMRLFALGDYTLQHLQSLGIPNIEKVPGGELSRLAEVI